MSTNERILSPFTLPNGTELKNRLLMAPMTTCTGYYDGTVTSELVEYYRARSGSIGTIIVECCFIDDLGLVSTTTRKSPDWRKSRTPLNPKARKPCCRSTTAAVWSIRN